MAARNNTNTSSSAEDVNGHGTNVSGIITANGTVSGVGFAPDANIVAVRVLDQSGIGYLSDWIAGLDWVISNRITYQIRIVNMSLKATHFIRRCDAQQPSMSNAIAQLLAQNVSVFTASGNQGARPNWRACLYPVG